MLKKIFIFILLLCINLVSCSESKAVNSNNIEQSYKSTKAIELYVPDDNISKWVIEEEKVDISELKNVIVALKDTDKCCIPKDTKVNSIKIENKIAYVDLSKDFDDSQTGSSAAVPGGCGYSGGNGIRCCGQLSSSSDPYGQLSVLQYKNRAQYDRAGGSCHIKKCRYGCGK